MRSRPAVFLVVLIFFVISLITNILSPLMPDIIRTFGLSLALAAFLPFSFFVAYGVMSIPSGMLIERFGEKPVLASAFGVALAGSLAFALLPRYGVGLGSLFLIGIGMAMLQVAINPLLRVAGGEENFAFNSVMAQLVFGSASFLSPHIYSSLVEGLSEGASGANPLVSLLARVVPRELPWVSLYWIFAAVTALMVLVVLAARLPRVELGEDERAGAWATHVQLFRNRTVQLFTLGIFCYVGTEQGVANWLSEFLRRYHGYDPLTTGASAVAWFWGLMTAGCLLGLGLLKLFDSRRVLIGAALAAMVALSTALFAPAGASLVAFPLMGFCASVMWSIIFSLALNSVAAHHGSFSGILCTAITGGAVMTLLVGWVGDLLGLRQGMLLLYLPLGYILSIGLWARPLVQNATVRRQKADDGQ